MEHVQLIRKIYANTPILLWPVVWLRVILMQRTFQRLVSEGYDVIGFVWEPKQLRFRLTTLQRRDAADPFESKPRTEFVYAMVGYMPHNLWALTFNTVALFRDLTRGTASADITTFAILDPG